MTAFYIFIILVVLDVITPVLVRVFGVGEFPREPGEVRTYHADVGYVRLPRTAFLVLASVAFALLGTPDLESISIVAGCALSLAWFLTLGRDILRARRQWLAKRRVD